MINKIQIQSIATFPTAVTKIEKLKRVNFFFGSNATGKTTISKIIADSDTDDEKYAFCSLHWNNDLPLVRRVYNKDFFDTNFKAELKGIFTLGEENIELKNKIVELKKEIDDLQNKINGYNTTLNGIPPLNAGKRTELQLAENKYEEIFWQQKTKHYNQMKGGLEGFVSSKKAFKLKILEEQLNASELKTQNELEAKCEKIFTTKPTIEIQKIPVISFNKLQEYEKDAILSKKIIGKEDVNIAGLIKKLENSDWVRQGKTYLGDSNGVCPFCQQKAPNTLAKDLAEYFDTAFERDIKIIDELLSNYQTETERVLVEIENVIVANSPYIDIVKLNTEKLLFDKTAKLNIKKIQQKRKETSIVVELDLVKNIADNIAEIISFANNGIEENNALAKNITNERTMLTKQIWRFIVDEVKETISAYNTEKRGIASAIKSLEESIAETTTLLNSKKESKKEFEKKTTDILATLNGINKILTDFGFTSFKLETNKDNNAYKIVRGDGTDASATLSEGEKNFVAFLYFYYLLKGNLTTSDIGENMVVVIDDPVSSLDSEVLFIVTTLIRNLLFNDDEFRFIKQIFILTHNIYFHKAVSRGKSGNQLANSSFYVVKKRNNESYIEYYDINPVQSSYELLWKEITNKPLNNGTIRNTMRRIFENYFKLVGKIDIDKLFEEFAGNDKIICQSLVSWLHDGSHTITDDFETTTIDDEQVNKYMKIFKKIFIELGHENHYNLMTGKKEVNEETLIDEIE